MIKVKIFTGISLFLFFVTVTALLAAAFISNSNRQVSKTNGVIVGLNGVQKVGTGTSPDTIAEASFLTIEAVSAHSTSADCWMVINGAVYDLSPFLAAHPGGADVMLPYCGKDGTQAFSTKDKQPPTKHSVMATNMLDQYFIGRLGQQLAANPTPTSGGSAQRSVSPTRAATANLFVSNLTPTTSMTTSNLSLTTTEVARHSSPADCWVIISGKVYNLTSYLVVHPGGVSAISQYCGSDGTTGFATKNTGSSHSTSAHNLLATFLIGTLGSSIPVSAATPTNPPPTPFPTAPPGSNPTPIPSSPTPLPANLVLNMAEVSRHNNLADCWIIISGQVYDVTRYIVSHPGGRTAITNTCGTDATTAFNTRGGSGSHSNNARNLLSGYLIGPFNSSVQVNPTATPAPTTAPGQPTNTPIPQSGANLPQAILNRYPGATRRSGGYEDNNSWEGKINTSSGACREIKVNSSGSITEDKNC